jgi:ribonuclease Z
MKRVLSRPGVFFAALLVALTLGYGLGRSGFDWMPAAWAAGGRVMDPTGTAPDRYVYYPGTEALQPDEIRIVACGTGLPAARRSQAASCFLVELGNGEKFLFDIGTGSMGNIASLMIPMDFLTKIFISHLHTDHWGDLAGLWAGGWTAGRTGPLEVWGPSGAREDMGTKYAVEHFMKTYNWDYVTRAHLISSVPGSITVHEFDYKGLNQIVYQENGVTIRSWPAIHAGDGPVSFALTWNGYKIVYSGDTTATKWTLEYAKDADVVIHEVMPMPGDMVKWYNQPPERGMRASCGFHTCPPAFGKIMSILKPRHSVAFHWFNDEATRFNQYDGIRQTYAGPVSMATDMMVWNVRRDEIVERMAVSTDDAWDVPGPGRPQPPDGKVPSQYTEFILKGRFDTTKAEKQTRKEFNEKYGLE